MSPSQVPPQLLDWAPDAMLIVNAAGAILCASRQACALLGYEKDELTGRSVEQLMPERFRATHPVHRSRFTAQRRTRHLGMGLELLALRRDGTEIAVEVGLNPIRHGRQVLTVAAIRDVTSRRQAQADLIAAREAAESASRTADKAREAADRANQAKSRFLATASHDLRQPLQSLALTNGTLRRLVRDTGALTVLSRQAEAIGAMSQLLNALLEINRLESGAIKPSAADFPVSELFLAVRNEFSELAAGKGLELQTTPSAHLAHTDRALVGQILQYLVANAIQYTPNGRICLSAETCADGVRIDVGDSGVGIAPEELPRIYDDFYQIHVGSHAQQRGSGLGLSIVRRLVRLLDLQLEARSALGRGSVFSLTVPAGKSRPVPTRAPEAPASSPPAGPLVLVLEDDPAVRNATEMLLKVYDYRVLTAATIAQALEAAREHAIELLITDYHLAGGETGLQAITALRALLGVELKVVLLTGDPAAVAGLEQDTRLRLVGKPIHADQLIEILQALRSA